MINYPNSKIVFALIVDGKVVQQFYDTSNTEDIAKMYLDMEWFRDGGADVEDSEEEIIKQVTFLFGMVLSAYGTTLMNGTVVPKTVATPDEAGDYRVIPVKETNQ